MEKIILITHAQSEHHITKMIGGNSDWPLTELGKVHAHNIGKRIGNLIESKKTIIYSSDLIRAKQTAEIVNEYLKLDIVFKKELQEINVGIAKDKSKEWCRENKIEIPRGNTPLVKYRQYPNAETFEEVYNRTFLVIEEMLKMNYDNIIVVGHGCALIMFLLQWLRIPVNFLENNAIEINPGTVSILTIWEGKRMLNRWNDTFFKGE